MSLILVKAEAIYNLKITRKMGDATSAQLFIYSFPNGV
jgi:hypothetical protein